MVAASRLRSADAAAANFARGARGGGAGAFGEGGGAAGLLGRLEARGADLERRLFGPLRGRQGDVDPPFQLGDGRDRPRLDPPVVGGVALGRPRS